MTSTGATKTLNVSQATTLSDPLEQLYERYHRLVFHLALRYGNNNVAWAEDITHDIFLKLLSTPLGLVDHEALSGWFYRVTTRHCLNKLRHEALLNSAPLRWFFAAERQEFRNPESDTVASDELAKVAKVVGELPPKERLAFYMRYIDDKPQIEIALILGHSTSYVSKLLERARQRLLAAGWEVPDGE
jgi:RNA polymerase sigma-70 factor, ECF subfamily